MSGKLVMVRTLPFSSGNYGGVLQGFALQRFIAREGYDVVTDCSSPMPWWKRAVRDTYRAVRAVAPGRWGRRGRMATDIRRNIDAFVAARIRTTQLVERASTKGGRAKLGRRVGTIVVGSDQIWRPLYSDIPNAFLAFSRGLEVGRLSYAASFGRDDIVEYTDAEVATVAELLRKFDAVSVREDAGVSICAQIWGVTAEHHIDPTALLEAEEYRSITREVSALKSFSNLIAAYCLDDGARPLEMLQVLRRATGLSSESLLPPTPEDTRAWQQSPEGFRKASVEQWLHAIDTAEVLFTDSFHGCMFSILFNTPFIVFVNSARGPSRIRSLLRTFDLEHHLMDESSDLDIDARVLSPDWAQVNSIMESERGRGAAYLRHHLAADQ